MMKTWYRIEGDMIRGAFIRRLNRFLAEIYVEEKRVLAHLHDSGRLKELLVEGAEVIAVKGEKSVRRKSSCTLYFVKRGRCWFTVNSSLPNRLFHLYLLEFYPPHRVKAEVQLGKKRVDFAIFDPEGAPEEFIEVKGVNLMKNGVFLFPDAPTLRGRLHVKALTQAVQRGRKAKLVFIAGSPCARHIALHEEMDPDFARAVRDAVSEGVVVEGYAIDIKLPGVRLKKRIPVNLS